MEHKLDFLSHAILLHGMKGIGKSSLAKDYAKSFICSGQCELLATDCNACKMLASGNNPDLLICKPIFPSNVIKLEQIIDKNNKHLTEIDVHSFSKISPLISKNKVVIILDADLLTKDAAHSLLKLLEEPPVNVKFILTTSRLSKMLDTVISRCVLVECSNVIKKAAGDIQVDSNPFLKNVFSDGSQYKDSFIDEHVILYQSLHDALVEIFNNPKEIVYKAYKLSQCLEDFSKDFEKKASLQKREATLEVLYSFSLWWKRFFPSYRDNLKKIIDVHRFISMNGNIKIHLDALSFYSVSLSFSEAALSNLFQIGFHSSSPSGGDST